jgi:hypothetical protein
MFVASINMENLPKRDGFRAVVGIRGHDVAHVLPPFLADGCLGDGVPARFILNLGVGEKLPGFGMKKDGVIVDTVLFEDSFQFRPDGPVTFLVFGFLAGIHGHDERFADHLSSLLVVDIGNDIMWPD